MTGQELTRDFLMDVGGHVEMKKARALHRERAVKAASFTDGLLSGEVRIGGKVKKVSMEIFSRTNIENHCKCLMVRRDGRVCAHVMALGLELLEPMTAPGNPSAVGEGGASSWPALGTEGEKITLQVMLPAKVEEAWARGALMSGFGFIKDGEEFLLGALPAGTYALDPVDEELWLTLQEIFPEGPPAVVNLKTEDFARLLSGLPGHERVFFGKKCQARVWPGLPTERRKTLEVRNDRFFVQPGNLGRWELAGEDIYPLALALPERYGALFSAGLVVSAGEAEAVLAELQQWFNVPEEIVANLPPVGTPTIRVTLEGSLRHLDARLEFFYEGRKGAQIGGEISQVGKVLTNPALEDGVVDFFRSWNFEGPGQGGRMTLREREEILKFHAFAQLPGHWEVEKGERYLAAAAQVVPVRPEWEFKPAGGGQDWFALETGYQAGSEEISRDQIQRMLRMGRSEQAFGKGKIAVLDASFIEEAAETLADSEGRQVASGVFEVSARQAAFLRQSARDFGMKAPQEEEYELELPDYLRPYQQVGVKWLYRLSQNEMGGILADDMGLGKTLQTLTYIEKKGGRALVVCPSSLVSNWAAEAKKWTPGLSVAEFVGPKRGNLPDADLIITSYAILRIDQEKIQERDFDIAVLDEAQQIKNAKAKVSQAAHRLKARHRFALSGTPVENSLGDLWSIMNFALPGYLGQREAFMERFEKPMRSAGGDPSLGRRLARKLKPVVLRRLKTEVAKDLPDRIEQVRYCELTTKQRSIYNQILRESRSQVDQAGDGQKRMVALTALLRLRQACCDLRLLPNLKVEDQDAGIKLAELEMLLEEAVRGGHRVLVFSQFVQLLQGIVPMLAGNGWDYCYLDGSTKKRGEVVERFQGGAAPIFLISLKAGGVGLNLTAADTVVHLDPWWNPAVEAQATDRAHRIGQKKVVTSYKFITRGTVEEKILALQEEKKTLMEAALDGTPSLVPGLEEDELMGLFS